MTRTCLDCGTLHNRPDPRCRPCYLTHQQRRNHNPRRQALYSGPWATLSRRARATSPMCFRCGARRDLTLDHETGTVECRPCNSSHRRNVER